MIERDFTRFLCWLLLSVLQLSLYSAHVYGSIRYFRATDDLNFILHSIKIIEKTNQSLACRCLPPHSVQSIVLTRAKKKRAKQVFRVHRSTQTSNISRGRRYSPQSNLYLKKAALYSFKTLEFCDPASLTSR